MYESSKYIFVDLHMAQINDYRHLVRAKHDHISGATAGRGKHANKIK